MHGVDAVARRHVAVGGRPVVAFLGVPTRLARPRRDRRRRTVRERQIGDTLRAGRENHVRADGHRPVRHFLADRRRHRQILRHPSRASAVITIDVPPDTEYPDQPKFCRRRKSAEEYVAAAEF